MNELYRNVNENIIHRTAIISKNARLGRGNFIGPYCVIQDHVQIGDENIFEAYCSIGSPAEHKDETFNRLLHHQTGKVVIGSRNHFREFITVNKPTKMITMVGSDCYIMRSCHVSHDTIVCSRVIMSCNVILGGHTQVLEGAYMGLKSCTHPHTIIGHYSMIGMSAVVTRNIPPLSKAYGVPATIKGMNDVGIKRNSIDEVSIKRFEKEYNKLIQTEMF